MGHDRRELLAIFVGGVCGALARAAFADALPHRVDAWPWATFLANVAGAALLGFAAVRLQERLPVSVYRRPLVGTGFCGALTTFSTMQLELLRMLDAKAYALAVAYAATSIAVGFAAILVTANLVRRVRIA